jgi:hypothetical protein
MELVMLHWVKTDERSRLMRESVLSLLKHRVPLIVVNNGGEEPYTSQDTDWLQSLAESGSLRHIKMPQNEGFASRNVGLSYTTEEVVGIIDNDIIVNDHPWILEEFVVTHKNLFATGVKNTYSQRRWERPPMGAWRVNDRAGSNFLVGKKRYFDHIGPFANHPKSGCKWQDKLVHLGYSVALAPKPFAQDLGKFNGFNFEEREAYSHKTAKKNWHAIKPYVRKGATRILDVGCGSGHLVSLLTKKGLHAVGVDIVHHGWNVIGSATDLPFKDNEFDLIIVSDVLEHLTAHENDLAYFELFRVAPVVLARVSHKDEVGHLTVHPLKWWKEHYPNYTYL